MNFDNNVQPYFEAQASRESMGRYTAKPSAGCLPDLWLPSL